MIMEFANQVDTRGLFGQLQITRTGCLGACGQGPVVLVYPDAVMYGEVSAADVVEIVEDHVIGGQPVERLRVPHEVW